MLSDALDFNSSGSRSEGSVFSKTEHSVIAAYLIVAGTGVYSVTCFSGGRRAEVLGTRKQCGLAHK